METEQKSDRSKDEGPASYEDAMTTAGFGIFNLFLILVGTFGAFTCIFETSTMSYLLPVAECDLKLTLFDKGTLNAATYAGMIMSAPIWGYLSDTLGRRKVLIYGYLADAICAICCSLTQNFQMLVTFKFFGGFIVNGPAAVLVTYLMEMHGAKHRPRVIMAFGMMNCTGMLVLPLIAWAIFPRHWDFVLFDSLTVHTWQIFLAVCSLPSFISGICFVFLPESPKFLMSQGRNAEALHSFQKMYACNKKKPMYTYPIKELVEEVPNRSANDIELVFTVENRLVKPKFKREPRTFFQAISEGIQQIKPLFKKPLFGRSLHVYAMQMCILLGLNTIRLWLPQLFASIGEYEALESSGTGSASLCTILEYSVNKTAVTTDFNYKCSEQPDVSMALYTNNIIVAISGLVGYSFAGVIVKTVGAKRLLTFGLLTSGCLAIGLYWSVSGLTTLIISSAFLTVTGVSTSSLLGILMTLFPTSLRSLVVSIAMMFGRLGALSGNILFPIFVEMGCIQPFLMVGLVLIAACALSCILPSGKKFTLA